jgi:hypothetical protein
MKAGPSHQTGPGGDESDPLWRLLGTAPLPEPDGWFAARTLARCRHEEIEQDVCPTARKSWVTFAGMWRWALGGGLALSMAVAFMVSQIQAEKATTKQKSVQEAFEIVASMDTDSDSSSSSSWQDSSL